MVYTKNSYYKCMNTKLLNSLKRFIGLEIEVNYQYRVLLIVFIRNLENAIRINTCIRCPETFLLSISLEYYKGINRKFSCINKRLCISTFIRINTILYIIITNQIPINKRIFDYIQEIKDNYI